MPTNPYEPPKEPCELPPPKPERKLPPKSLGEALWRGAKAGWKWTTYIVGPVAIALLLALVVLERNGFPVATFYINDLVWEVSPIESPLSLYRSSCFWGILIGTSVACVRYALGWKSKED